MRMRHSLAVALGLLLPAACADNNGVYSPPVDNSSVASPPPPFEIRLQEVFGSADGLSGPIDLQAPPGDSRLFIAERPGRIRVVQGGALLPTPFLDIASRVFTDVEAGLLSFAFHPQFASDPQQRFVFVHFVERVPSTNGDVVVERYRVSAGDPNQLDASSAELVLRIPHRDFPNHYGGRVAFGPGGMLFVSIGDGGGDQSANGQSLTTHLGKLLRLDVSNLDPNAVPPYTIPPDNPVWPGTTQPGENWAIGLRNPFRYAFDVPTARLVIGDVGQDRREEIDVVPADSAGLNYGWNIREGTLCFAIPCRSPPGLTEPVYEYDHSQGGCAIIGGYVYRGAAMPELQGQYLFSDFCGGFVRSLSIENGAATVREAPMVNAGANVQSFGQDGAGELYILTADDRVLRIVRP